MRINVLIVHQSAELYGSDRSLLDFIEGLPKEIYSCDVLLPESGPLEDKIKSMGFNVYVGEVVKVSRSILSVFNLIKMPIKILKSIKFINKSIDGKKIDLVYTNTVAVLGGAFWARMHGVPHVWHVREVIERPWIVSKIFQMLVNKLATCTISNSHSTRYWVMGGNSSLKKKSHVVWNGVRSLPENMPSKYLLENKNNIKSVLGVPLGKIVLLLPGRINNWKGQDLLVSALSLLKSEGVDNFFAAIVGSPLLGQEHLAQDLQEFISSHGLDNEVKIYPFTDTLHDHFSVADIVVVPSRLPEPFGRVAIEAMSYGIPVIAAKHGGLVEIVENNKSGILFNPNNEKSLANAVRVMMNDGRLRSKMGSIARNCQREKFSLVSYQNGVMKILREEVRNATA